MSSVFTVTIPKKERKCTSNTRMMQLIAKMKCVNFDTSWAFKLRCCAYSISASFGKKNKLQYISSLKARSYSGR